MINKDLSVLFEKIADALDIKGEAAFKVLAYRKSARVLLDLSEDVESLAREGRLREIESIGDGIARKIEEYMATGRMAKSAEAAAGLPEGLFTLLEIPGLGAKTVGLAFKELKIAGIDDLKRTIGDGRLARLPGMGDKKVENIRKGIELYERGRERLSIADAAVIADEIIGFLRRLSGIGRISTAGSLRRGCETVGDIDILAEGKAGQSIIAAFSGWTRVKRVLASGETKGSVLLDTDAGDRQADLRLVEASSFGAALQYFTGSKAHNVKLRGLAKTQGLKINEYGVFRGEKKIAGKDEESVYRSLGLPWIPPELREDRGEIERAQKNDPPILIEATELRGDLHCHTQASDGHLSLQDLTALTRKMGYAYVAVCDHSRSARYAGGLTPERLAEQGSAIDLLNRKFKGFRVLKGSEVDILADGTLDFPDDVLAGLDFVVASVHSGFKKDVTARMIKALSNRHVDMIGHPSGRLLSGREGYDVDLTRVMGAAREYGKALELNSHVDRLDLNELFLRQAADSGVKIGIGTDSHSADGPAMMRFGLGIARRGWLEKGDVLNTMTAAELARWRRARKK